jgi:tetratricopeptide (TPR) repeat protein
MYMPSLGFCICLTHFLVHFTKTEKVKSRFKNIAQFFSTNKKVFLLMTGLLFLYSFKTITRNKYWKNNLSLYSNDIRHAGNSATANKILGSALYSSVLTSTDKQARADTFQMAKHYLNRALEIYPGYTAPLPILGVIYYLENNFDSAFYYQNKEIKIHKDDIELNGNYGKTLNKLKNYDEAIQVSLHGLSLDPKNETINFNLALAYTNKGDHDKGFFYLSKVIELNPQRGDAWYYSGLILKAKGDMLKANEFLTRAAALGFKQ